MFGFASRENRLKEKKARLEKIVPLEEDVAKLEGRVHKARGRRGKSSFKKKAGDFLKTEGMEMIGNVGSNVRHDIQGFESFGGFGEAPRRSSPRRKKSSKKGKTITIKI